MIAKIPAKFKPQGTHADQLAILANYMMLRTSMTDERKHGHWISIPQTTWIRLIGRKNYLKVKREAIRQKLIEFNPRYSVGHFPMSYRLSRQFRSGKTTVYTMSRKPRLSQTNRYIDWENLGDVGRHLFNQFYRFRLGSTDKTNDPWTEFLRHEIKSNRYFACRCEYGRFHSNFTNIRREVRHSLTINTVSAIELDIKNSQPLCLAIKTAQKMSNTQQGQQTRHGGRTMGKDHNKATYPYVYPYLGDTADYLRLCEDGAIYEFLLDRCHAGDVKPYRVTTAKRGQWQEDPRDFDRCRIKRNFLIAIFGNNQQTAENAVFRLFRCHFPSIAKFIEQTKRNDYRRLAHDLQRLESTIMIDGVCQQLRRDYLDEPVLTVHDSLIVRPKFEPTARQLIIDHFQKHGVTPKVTP